MRLQTFWALLVVTLLGGCGGDSRTATLDDLYSREIRMPDGAVYRAEVLTKPFDMTRGMMFRDSLPGDRGMLFIYGQAGRYPAWTYQNRLTLDVIWLDANRLITEIVADAAPCKEQSARLCPSIGGSHPSLYVIEFNAGTARKHGLKPGDRLDF